MHSSWPAFQRASEQTPQRRIVGLVAQFASLVGARKIEFLDLAWPQVDFEAGIVRLKRAKQRGRHRGEVVDAIAITPALLACLLELKADSPTDCLYVFPTRYGGPYTDHGFKTLWQRIVLAATGERVFMGWLMGLEPTTTGITILAHFRALARLAGRFLGLFSPLQATYRRRFRPVCPTSGGRQHDDDMHRRHTQPAT